MHLTYKKWLEDNKPKIYCQCPDHEEIIIKEQYKYDGIPKYINGHNGKGKHPSKETIKKISGENNISKRPEVRKKISDSKKGFKHTEKAKQKMSKNHGNCSGDKNSFYGKHHTDKSKQKISNSKKGKLSGENNPNWKPRIKKICLKCGKEFEVLPYLENIRKYCSIKCGYSHEWSEEYKKKLSESTSMENSIHWKGGISFLPYSFKFNKELKEKIRSRDNHTCQLCGKIEEENKRNLTVHHIHYDKENNNPDLITLCCSCNSKVNNNRDYYEQYFMDLLYERFGLRRHFEGDI